MAQIACIGVGLVGAAWAAVMARAGHDVRLYDEDKDRLLETALPSIRATLESLATAEENPEPVDRVAGQITVAGSLSEAVADVAHVQESVREDVEIKRRVALAISEAAPAEAIIASSTSALPGSTFLTEIRTPRRALVAHPVNPPSHISLVELCGTGLTTPETLSRAEEFYQGLGMSPVRLEKEIDGFLLNRLQYTLVAEALHLVAEGYASPEDIDRVLTEGLAPRWAFIGPFMTAHLNARDGFRGFVDQLGPMMRRMGEDARTDYPWGDDTVERIHSAMAARVPNDQIPAAQLKRNARLLELRALRRRLDDATD
jgi:3-hydroxyacyl-CoA dehydrogenase